MLSVYIGVYKALYEYAAQAEEELTLYPDDILYLLEKSEIDDWWKVKKRVLPVGDEEVDEPTGLVPSNYIEEAPVVKTATALYDYTKQTEEELSFTEGEKFEIYDLNDPDWLLAGDSQTRTQFGFVPANYLELDSGAAPQNASYAPPIQNLTAIAPPPLHPSQINNTPAASAPVELRQQPEREMVVGSEDEEEAPPMPTRPSAEPSPKKPQRTQSYASTHQEDVEELESTPNEHTFDGEFFTWYIDEVEGRKKRAVILSVGQGLIIMKPNTTNPKKLKLKSSSSLDNQWRVKDLLSFSNEKKHLFLELRNPESSVELHTGTKDVAEAIMSILGDLKGAESAKALREVARASQATTGEKNRKIGRLQYDFEAQSQDELGSREGDEVYIINETKSKEWWMCENILTGKQGVIPSSYIQIIGTSNLEKLTDAPQRTKSKSSKGRVVDGKSKDKSHRHRTRDERDRIREKDKIQRDKHASKVDENDKSMPNYHRVRTWIDSSGSFKVEAEFLGCVEGKIHLHKTNGVKIAVAATKLCLEDLDYVEKVTGTSLESYKKEVIELSQKKSKSKSSGVSKSKSATAAINDLPPPQPSRPKTTTQLSTSEPDYDWFEFFLQCGVDIGNCQRYSLNFSREQMDENILEDISPSLLRTLGLREGDILRVMKFLDNKFDRKKPVAEEPESSGGLFTEPTGALKNNNSTSEISKVNADALPSSQNKTANPTATATATTPASPSGNKFEDDAWAVKPAARSNEDLSRSQPQTPQYTGALQDLVNIKPLESNSTAPPASNVNKPMPSLPQDQTPSAPSLTPVKTGTLIQPGQQFEVQKTGTSQMTAQRTGLTAANTGGLIPVQATGLIPVQPTGFIPITAQPTGFVPIQATGIQPQFTYNIVPLQTGTATFTAQRTGGQQTGGALPQTSFGQQPFQPSLHTGGVTMPQTSFGQPGLISGQITGGLPPTGLNGQPLSLQQTGPLVPAQRTGGFVPQSIFGQQITGGFINQPPTSFGQSTGGLPQNTFGQSSNFPSTSFSQQPTGGFPSTSFSQQPTGGFSTSFSQQPTSGFPPTSFGQLNPPTSFNQLNPPTSFSLQPTGSFPSTLFGLQTSNGFPQTSFSQQPTGGLGNFNQQPSFATGPQQSFGQPGFNQFAQQPYGQQQFGNPQANQFGQQAQPNMGQLNNMFQNTSISQNGFQQQPTTSFGQDSFQPLQSQPTGAGFGNAPASLQSQPTGRRANLSAATPDNPFGF
ncbi:uncharacterized protein CANTADRAFT_102168 [Suhomyces tanzawaensis NRRL Y-17324]|uniref:Actin cytoskeleton-regulatory complex protein SLA1 n=1 Tax=Suhomyces tanzawaensis NRRL Y-17324 TaxID=984487 RepID=A0A1E4SCN5_9ASCO|nr:uncharacterized protein CANTADRAFT_102168 [Suhomyces tanzawaensis NRRL Y-17324]ODV77280.1 hypothetical protein CANTADRAFT_102168 [Suhomyces tanzawaensis NRRL Y-17324]